MDYKRLLKAVGLTVAAFAAGAAMIGIPILLLNIFGLWAIISLCIAGIIVLVYIALGLEWS